MIVFNQLGNLGRLGNQLFQIAATLAHAKEMNVDAVFPQWKYKNYFMNKVDDILNTEYDYRFRGILHDLHAEPGFHYSPIPLNKNLVLHGFFQSEKYFIGHKDYVLSHFMPTPEFYSTIRDAGGSTLNLTNLCSIHVRRGDYLTNEDHQNQALPMEYYRAALMRVMQHCGDKANFLILSDDIPWCKKAFGTGFIYSEGNSEIIDLFLMSMCRHHIMANSSMSWWGTYLSQLFGNQEQRSTSITIAPTPWFGPAFKGSTDDLYVPGWVKMPAASPELPVASSQSSVRNK